MNQKLISTIVSFSFVMSLLPTLGYAENWDGSTISEPSKNEAGEYEIGTAEELAWFSVNAGSSGNAVLTADIDLAGQEWTAIGGTSSDSAYSGSFNGNGHTISGFKINSERSTYSGLFAYVTGTVSNLSVTGELQALYSGYSTSYTGGIAAYNAGTIENCATDMIINTNSSYSYVGGIAGYNCGTITGCLHSGTIRSKTTSGMGGIVGDNYDGKISLSANLGELINDNSYGYYAGGIVGRAESYTVIDSVYNMGDITCSSNVGGIAGSFSAVESVTNCYNAGNVNCTSTSRYAYYGGIGSYGYSSNPIQKMSNCYFLKSDTVNTDLSALQSENSDTVCALTEDELKSNDFIVSLGGSFTADSGNINNGYPILKWQDPNVSYKAQIRVIPENAQLILSNSNGEELSGSVENGLYGFDDLEKGEYSYIVSNDADDYEPQSMSFNISNNDYYNTVTLKAHTYNVLISVEPATADFALMFDDTEIIPSQSENGKYAYSLANGSYSYSASLFGYGEIRGSIVVDRDSAEESINLERVQSVPTSFVLTDITSGQTLDNFRMEIKYSDYVVPREADGSYILPAGTYTYKAMCSGYAKCIGEFEVSQADIDAGEKQIALETTPSSAWDGDMDEPIYSDGAWQIATGNELAWFAGYVNGTQAAELSDVSYNAVLTKDIDLGSELNWTPIGMNDYSHTYSGTFDGCGHTVSGLNINSNSTCVGLFGKISVASVIKNLTVEGKVKTTSTSSYAYAGGICGYNYKGEILNCTNKVNVTSNGGRTGGISGASEGDGSASAKISKCLNYGSISYEEGTGQYKGGITGESRYTNISECANMGAITGNGNFLGGIAGDLYSGSVLTDSYNTGTVSSTAYSFGGIAGRTDLYGSYGMTNCYNAGEVVVLSDSCQNYGALIGLYSGGLNENCYCLIEDDGTNSGLSAIGKVDFGTPSEVTVKASADEMRDILATLNANNKWTWNSKLNNGYPIFIWQNLIFIKIDDEILNPVTNLINAGEHRIDVDYSLMGKEIENGILVLALYNSDNTLEKLWLSDEAYTLSAEYDIPSGSVIKVLFWKDALASVTDAVMIDVI